jgi:hypothetical protein
MKATFEADNGVKFTFYREHATEYVRIIVASGREVTVTLEKFCKIIRKEYRRRKDKSDGI